MSTGMIIFYLAWGLLAGVGIVRIIQVSVWFIQDRKKRKQPPPVLTPHQALTRLAQSMAEMRDTNKATGDAVKSLCKVLLVIAENELKEQKEKEKDGAQNKDGT